jgi:hypothetical protein
MPQEPIPQEGAEPKRSDAASPAIRKDQDEPMLWCPICSTKLESRRCKLFCEKCGYYMSCADYY